MSAHRSRRSHNRPRYRGVYGVDDRHQKGASLFDTKSARDDYVCTLSNRAGGKNTHRITLLTSWVEVQRMILDRRNTLLADSDAPEKWREFIVNKRDFPLIKRTPTDAIEPPHPPSRGLPCFSQYSCDQYADLHMPTLVDYRHAWGPDVFFPHQRDIFTSSTSEAPPAWSDRLPTVIFRGGATGWGVHIDTNVRLLACHLCAMWRAEQTNTCEMGVEYLDAALTSWNPRMKCDSNGTVDVIDPSQFAFGASATNFMSPDAQQMYKYTLYLDGHVGADRLGVLARGKFVLLVPACSGVAGPHVGLRKHMTEWTHYVPVASNLSDLKQKIIWLREHDEEARAVAESLHTLYTAEYGTHQQIEHTFAAEIAALGAPLPPDDVRTSLEYMFFGLRSAIYVLIDDVGHIRTFAPFANSQFRNTWAHRLHGARGETLREIIARARRFDRSSIIPNPQLWWSNGRLICNTYMKGVWGEGFIDIIHVLVEYSAKSMCL